MTPTTAKDARERVAVILRSRAVCAVAAGSVGTFTATELLTLANDLDPEHAVTLGKAMEGTRGALSGAEARHFNARRAGR